MVFVFIFILECQQIKNINSLLVFQFIFLNQSQFSKIRQFNNKYLKSMWSESCLQARMLVFGKISSYPWWPGKIVEIIQQHNRTVYKVTFIGDSSYSYLHHQDIIPYPFFNQHLNQQFPADLKLEKAILQAKRIAEKNHLSFRSTDEEISSSRQITTAPPSPPAPTPLTTPIQLQPNSQPPLPLIQEIISSPITHDNVIDLIKMSTAFVNTQGYCYSNRKDCIKFKEQLQATLLQKYRLSNIPHPSPKVQHIGNNQHHNTYFQHKKVKKMIRKHRNTTSSQQMRLLMIKKMQRKMNQGGQSYEVSKLKSIALYNQLMTSFGGITSQLKQSYIKMIRTGNKPENYSQPVQH